MVRLLPCGNGNQTGLDLSALSVRSGVEMSEKSDKEKSGAEGAEVEFRRNDGGRCRECGMEWESGLE